MLLYNCKDLGNYLISVRDSSKKHPHAHQCDIKKSHIISKARAGLYELFQVIFAFCLEMKLRSSLLVS